MKLNIQDDEAMVEGEDGDFLSLFMQGCKGNVNIKTPFGKRKVKMVDKFKSKPDKKEK